MNQFSRTALVPAAVLAGLCPLVANSIHQRAADGEQVVIDAAAAQPLAAQVSVALFLSGFASLVVVLGVLAAALARRSPAHAGVVAVAGGAAVAVKLAEVQTLLAFRESADLLDPATAELLVSVDDAGFVVYGLLLGLALGTAGHGLVRGGVVPRWLGWWGAAAGALSLLSAAIGIVVPPHYVPIPFLFLLLWLVALGVVATRRPFVDSAAPRPLARTQ